MVTKLYPWLQAYYEQVLQQLAAGRLHHGLLFEASPGMGKYQLAQKTAMALLCQTSNACGQCKSCLLFLQQSHPDYVEISDLEANSIGVDAIRAIVSKAQQKSQLSGAQVFVIRDSHKLTESAANALLKTLEEPGLSTYIVLTTASTSQMLPTIISRCQQFSLKPPEINELSAWLHEQGYSVDDFHVAYQDVGLSPLIAVELLNTDYIAQRTAYLTRFKQLLAHRIDPIAFVSGINEEQLTHHYRWMMQALMQWLKVKSAKSDDKPAEQQLMTKLKIERLYKMVLQAQQQNGYNGVNKKLNYQQLCLAIANS